MTVLYWLVFILSASKITPGPDSCPIFFLYAQLVEKTYNSLFCCSCYCPPSLTHDRSKDICVCVWETEKLKSTIDALCMGCEREECYDERVFYFALQMEIKMLLPNYRLVTGRFN